MRGGEGVFMLASSHALTSRMTPVSGRCGRGGNGFEGLGRDGSTGIGINGIAGAVCGGSIEMLLHKLPSPFFARLEDCYRRRRCSHCFADLCLLLGAENVFLVVVNAMLTMARGAAGEDIVR